MNYDPILVCGIFRIPYDGSRTRQYVQGVEQHSRAEKRLLHFSEKEFKRWNHHDHS